VNIIGDTARTLKSRADKSSPSAPQVKHNTDSTPNSPSLPEHSDLTSTHRTPLLGTQRWNYCPSIIGASEARHRESKSRFSRAKIIFIGLQKLLNINGATVISRDIPITEWLGKFLRY
jgi:hypothetical protein